MKGLGLTQEQLLRMTLLKKTAVFRAITAQVTCGTHILIFILLPFCSCCCVWAWVGCAGCWDGGGGGAGSGCWGWRGLARVGIAKKAQWQRSRKIPSDRRLANAPLSMHLNVISNSVHHWSRDSDVACVTYWQVFVILLFITLKNNVLKENNLKQTSIISGWSVILRRCYRATVLQEAAKVKIRVCGLKWPFNTTF